MEPNKSYSGSTGARRTEDQDTFGYAAQDVSRDAQRRGQEVFSKVADEAQSLTGRLRDEATGALGEGKTQLTAQIGGVARALKASSRELRRDNLGSLADLSDDLVGQVEAVEHYLGDRSSGALLEDFRSFAGRHRGLFVGSLFVAGLLAVRFAQSSPSIRRRSEGTEKTTPKATTPKTTVVSGRVATYKTSRP